MFNYNEERWAALEKNWTAWWNHDLERPLVTAFAHKHDPDRKRPQWWRNWWESIGKAPFSVSAEEVAEECAKDLSQSVPLGDAWPRVWLNFGPGSMAGYVGGEVDPKPETFWFYPGIWKDKDLRDIKPEYLADNPWWQRVSSIQRACAERFGSNAQVGFSDFGGNMDIAASLRDTEKLLCDLIDDPEGVDALVGRVTELWLRYYDEQYAIAGATGRGVAPWAPIWSPKRTYMLQSDFSYMISPAQFERWVLPDLQTCCRHMEHAFYHLDGKGELPHLDLLLSIPELRGIQWIPGDGQPGCTAKEWRWIFERVRASGKLMQQFASVPEIIALAKEFPLKGFIFETSGSGDTIEAGLDAIWKEAESFRKKQKPTVAV